METIAVGAWYIWWQRLEFVKGEKIAPAPSTAFSIRALTANFGKSTADLIPNVSKWIKPPPDHYKLNVDASFYPDGSGAAAAIIRNNRGCWGVMDTKSYAKCSNIRGDGYSKRFGPG